MLPAKSEAHHYVPQFHLREFGAETFRIPGVDGRFGRRPGHIWQFDKQEGEYRRVPISRAGQRPNYYSVAVPGAPELEKTFADMERMAASAIRSLHSLAPGPQTLDAGTKVVIATYAALLQVRTPAHRDPFSSFGNFSAAAFADMRLVSPEAFLADARRRGDKRPAEEVEESRAEMLAALRGGRLSIEVPYESTLIGMKAAVDGLIPMMIRMRWALWRASNHRFVLGDQPVTVLPPPGQRPLDGAGPATPGATVVVPLSPTALLSMSPGNPTNVLWVMPEYAEPRLGVPAGDANVSAWRYADRYVYARSKADLERAALLLPPASRNARPKLYVFGLPKEWLPYVGGDLVAGFDPDLPADLIKICTLPGDIDVPAHPGEHKGVAAREERAAKRRERSGIKP